MPTINMLSSADKVKGQGVGSAYLEQLDLVKNGLDKRYSIEVNKKSCADIMHYHTIDLQHYVTLPLVKAKRSITVGAVHFLPETVEGSLKLPKLATKVFYNYIIAFYKSMDYLVTVNPNFIDKLEAYGIPRNKVTYIPNYVSKEKFYPMDELSKLALRKKHGIAKDKFVVLCAGQLQVRKGIFEFIEIAKAMPDIQFIWAGGFSFGNITSGYKEVKTLLENPPENVKFTGIVEREVMNELYNIADVMFLPSYNELFPMIILEAMNCNTPILLRDIDVYPKILFDFYLKGNTNKEFIDHITNLKENTQFRNQCIQKSLEGSNFYSKENILAMWQEFYNEIMYTHKKVLLANGEATT
ncbi:MAG: glycosyltransferase family 4 protein [Candidatus Cellulosilyticum pullistercoris]|uniref:Glycosyltransferase family 4 protein n=1 Tax=Candidatus Cellulosilyticum pullistercoris TaxID=2838521 RepID=A0A9E2KBC5_9FIRM|nr:glycosyltransferase family 4 protein [Candidatus Cellulosilyticum pullistercoris]